MKAYLLSQGSEIWEITQNAAYVIPDERTTPLQVDQYNQNNKAINMLFAAIGNAEYERVCHLVTAREVWTTLAEHHEGIVEGASYETLTTAQFFSKLKASEVDK